MRAASLLIAGLLLAPASRAQFQANNECAGYTSLEIGVNPTPPFGQNGTTYANTFASLSTNFAAANCAPIANDVFFGLAPACSGNYRVSLCTPPGFAPGTIGDPVLEVYPFSACAGGGAPLACNDDACGLLSELTFYANAGATYLLRVGSYGLSAPGTFYVTAVPIDLPNDHCATAAPLGVGSNAGTTVCASPSSAAACPNFPATSSDAWHAFTPTQNCAFSVELTGSGGDCLAVYSGACGALTPIACLAGPPPLQTPMFLAAAGATYYVRVGETEFNGIGGFGPYGLEVDCLTSATSDECSGAIPVYDGVNPGAPAGTPLVAFNNDAATDSAGFYVPCNTGGFKDVFFQYTSTVDGPVNVRTCPPAGPGFAATLTDPVLAVFPASACPNGGAPIACDFGGCGPAGDQASATFAATAGVTYFIRVASWHPSSSGDFYLTIDPAPHETCAAAQPIAPGVTHGTTTTAVMEPGGGGVCSFGADVWYVMTAPALCDVQIDLALPPYTDAVLYEGGCGAFARTFCANGGPLAFLGNVPAGATLYLQVYTMFGAAPGTFAFTLTMNPPANNLCADPVDVFNGVNPGAPDGANGFMFTNVGATVEAASPGCTAMHSDVFFRYVSDCAGPIKVSMQPPPGFAFNNFDATMAVYPAACPIAPGSELACNDDPENATNNLSEVAFNATAGATYLIRVGGWGAAGSVLGEGSFYLTITRPFCLELDAPLGPGSLRVRNLNGPAFAPCLSIFTVLPGAYPYGPFFGIDPTVPEVLLQLASQAPPFVNVLDGSGASTFGPLTGAPTGLTLYAVSVPLNGLLQFGTPSPPTAFTVP